METFGLEISKKFELKKPVRQDLINVFVERINQDRKGTIYKPLKSDYDVKIRTKMLTNQELGWFLEKCEQAPNFSKHFYTKTTVYAK